MIQSIEDGVNCDDAERIGALIQTGFDGSRTRPTIEKPSASFILQTHMPVQKDS